MAIPTTTELDDLDILARRIARPLLDRIYIMERQANQLIENLAKARTELIEEQSKHARDVEWYIGKAVQIEEDKTILLEQLSEFTPRPKEHMHDPDEPLPVLTFDFDGTLKPQIAKGDGGNWPLTDKYSDPYPEVRGWLEKWKSQGACIHLATAGLYFDGTNDREIYDARMEMLKGWVARQGLPIDLILPKIPADCYYDDRMIEIPGDPSMRDDPGPAPDWDKLAEEAEASMARRFDIISGIWQRKDKKRVGTEIEDWPDSKLFRDYPRGYSGAKVDVDMHRTLSTASSSMRVAPPRDNAVKCMTEMYAQGITLTVSCAGWNPKTHSIPDSIRRLAGIRQWLQQWKIPYDRVAAKDHADLYFDDKGVRFVDWVPDMSRIRKKLPKTISYITH